MSKSQSISHPATSENKMGIMPVNKLLLSMALPMMLSMMVQALYNIVDSIFVSRLSQEALAAISLAFPMQNLMIAVGVGIGVGMNAVLSRSLGEKNQKAVNCAAEHGIFLEIIAYFIFLLIGIFLIKPFLGAQTQNANVLFYGEKYLSLICMLSFGCFSQIIMERMLQSTGKTFYAMITQAVGAIVNIILDPIMIFGLLGFPKLGIAGAAIATVIGQCIAALLAIYFNLKVNHEIQIHLRDFRIRPSYIGKILYVGVPSIIMVSIGSIMTFGVNKILDSFSYLATAVFGIYFRIQSIIFMPVFGLNNAMVPIIAFNYGAKKKDRLTLTVKLSVIYACAIMFLGMLILQFFPVPLLNLFDASSEMLAYGVPALRIISLCFLTAGFNIVCSSVFQALGNGILSMICSFVRQLIFLLPAAYLLSLTGKLTAVWFAFPIAEISAFILSILFLKHILRTVIHKMEE